MRQKRDMGTRSAEQTVRDIRRATRRQYSSEEKIRIVLEGLRGEESIAVLSREVVTMRVPSGLKAALYTEPLWPLRTWSRQIPAGSRHRAHFGRQECRGAGPGTNCSISCLSTLPAPAACP